MESKTAQNIQDTFLNTVRKDKSQNNRIGGDKIPRRIGKEAPQSFQSPVQNAAKTRVTTGARPT